MIGTKLKTLLCSASVQEKVRLLEKQLALTGDNGSSRNHVSMPRTRILIVFRNVEGDFQLKAQSKYRPTFEKTLAAVWSSVQLPGCLHGLALKDCFTVRALGGPLQIYPQLCVLSWNLRSACLKSSMSTVYIVII